MDIIDLSAHKTRAGHSTREVYIIIIWIGFWNIYTYYTRVILSYYYAYCVYINI